MKAWTPRVTANVRAEPVMRRLSRSAVRMADILELPDGALADASADGDFTAADEELHEASLAYARSLSPAVRKASAL